MKTLEFILSLRPALPMSKEKPCTHASNGEVRRWLRDKSVLINGRAVAPEEEIEFPVVSLVLFPKSQRSRCTLY